MDKNIQKIAVLGVKHGWKFAHSLTHHSSYVGGKLIALSSRSILSNSEANKIKNIKLYSNYRKMLDELTGKVDGIIAALPTDMHLSIVEEAAKRRIPILLEKPIAGTIEESEEIINIVNKFSLPFMVGHHRRFSPRVNIAKQIIENGGIGKLICVNMIWCCKKNDPYFKIEWHVKPNVGGPLATNASHDIDLLRYIVGEIEQVQAFISNKARSREVEDSGVAIFKLKNGVLANYIYSDGTPSKLFYDSCTNEDPFFYPTEEDCYYFFGDKGALLFPSMRIIGGTDWNHPYHEKFISFSRHDPIVEETKYFCEMIQGKLPSKCTAEDATMTLKVIEAIRKSSSTGSAVYV